MTDAILDEAVELPPALLQRLASLVDRPDPPADGELWDPERLEQYGRFLASGGRHVHDAELRGAGRGSYRSRLRENARALESAHHAIVAALQAGRAISPAAQWIVDNFHVISDHLNDIPLRLDQRAWGRLPLAGHGAASTPRILLIAAEYLSHTLWDFRQPMLVRLLLGYQEVAPLQMQEIWSLHTVLRLALIEELRRIAIRVEDSLAARAAADTLADALLSGAAHATGPEKLAWPAQRFTAPFIVQLAHRLQGLGERGRPLLDALAQRLAHHGTTIDDYIQRQHARRSASNVAARNIITSLRALASFDWWAVFEKTSRVEALLRERPDYLACDRRTRARYRASIEQLARAARRPEPVVTAEILAVVAAAPNRASDLGAWLIGARHAELEIALRCPVTLPQRLRRWTVRHGSALYRGSIVALTAAIAVLALLLGTQWRLSSPAMLALLLLLAALPASELVIAVLNRQWLRFFPPRHLPCLALKDGLSPEMKTLVVVPTLLRSVADAAEACRQLHVHALAAPDPLIRFALLSDWVDSDTQSRPEDEAILAATQREIDALNAAESLPGMEPKYYLLHRRRQWNAGEGRFIGWERKRGKLEELNRLLLDRGPTSFLPDTSGRVRKPAGVRYVLTLDADTRLPLGAVHELIGTAAHPLNRPQVSTTEHRVVAGYAVLQPRITPLLPGVEEHSLYREIATSGSGVDPYAVAASDLHQDLFGEGQFTGKGLYDLAAWESVLHDRVPANTVLSHDLLEGLFARCALVSDVELFEDFPSHSEVAAARQHRWMRGDWQLLPWILGRRGPLPPLGRWKMLDNLRRSLLAPCSMALLIAAFANPLSRPLVWLLLVLGPALWPALVNALERLARLPMARSRHMHLRRVLFDFNAELGRAAVALALLAQNAWLAVDAIARALYRMAISRRHLLEWTTAAQSKSQRGVLLSSFEWPLKSASIVVVGAVAVLMLANPPAVVHFAPLLLLWWLSPLLARFLSSPLYRPDPRDALSAPVERELRSTARLTWSFFERFVTAEENHLPPDNFQEDPLPVVAHRTSPTNVGLYLLSTVAARDFGWLGLQATSDRLCMTLATLQRMERFRGHFLNWYDTRSLVALSPQYVSTVDSGNLAGHLLTLRQACFQMRDAPLLSARAFSGPMDALELCRRALQEDTGTAAAARGHQLQQALRELARRLATPCATLASATIALHGAANDIALQLREDNTALPADATRWLARAGQDIHSHLLDLQDLDDAAALPRDATLAMLAQRSPRHALLAALLTETAEECRVLAQSMSFGFLYDRGPGLFSIGYRVADRELDESHYDLLASEARLASLVAIARADVPYSHWFQLGRRLTGGSRRPVLASWSGSMFEYLMPTLVLQEPPRSLLDQSSRRAVREQIAYGQRHRLPWGISESAWNVRDREYTYQYSAFGLPTLGLKRGLGADYVVAPYATALAAMYRPAAAAANLRVLAEAGGRGEYGYFEALDYTAARVPEGRSVAVVHAYMAHHQGMSLVALDNALHEGVMRARFHAEPAIATADLLLQERCIRFVEAPALIEDDVPLPHEHDDPLEVARTVEGFRSPAPVTHLLSNRLYTVMLTESGAGYSTWRGRAVTRWREDGAQDCWGSFIYLRDVDDQRLWSAGFQPTAAVPDEYRVHFNEECAYITRRDGSLRTTLAVVVTPDDNGELRRITLRNDGSRPRSIELTSYAEVVLAPPRADIAHPAFSNLFVQTEFLPDSGALLAMRRPRSEREAPLWAVHVIASADSATAPLQYETDRYRFIGRGHSSRLPLALRAGQALSNTAGNVLDPVFSLRTRISVPPRTAVSVTFATFVAESREQALALAVKYRAAALFDHVMESAWTFARADLHYLRSSLGEALLFQELASHLLMPTGLLRGAATLRERNTLDVTHLWRHSISGDRPILLVRCHSLDDLSFIQQVLRAQEYLRIKQLVFDVVILNERRHSYMRDLQQAIERIARTFGPAGEGGDRGGIFTLALEAMSTAEQALLVSLARVVMYPSQGSLQEQLSRPVPRRLPVVITARDTHASGSRQVAAPAAADQLEFFNGWGGFTADDEYRIRLTGAENTPAPWSNVLANEHFGSLVTERGAMFTWSLNSRENQLTPWSNDPICDPSGECFYLVADDGEYWSPAPQPVRHHAARYEIIHGQGYSRFEVAFREFHTTLTVLVTPADPVKLCHLRITNQGNTTRRITAISYVEWALAASRALPGHDVQTWTDAATGAQFAANPALIDFGSRIAFCDLGGSQQHRTSSRHDFLGRNGSTAAPAGLWNFTDWANGGAADLDACCAFATSLELRPGATAELTLVLGQAADTTAARALVNKYREAGAAAVLNEVRAHWSALLDTVRIRTPDRALDLLFNRWLPYQTIACRLWGRSAFYQCGGAYGFRDQLQDGMAVNLLMPQQVRAHLLRAAARQFPEGDVQHWWHPPSGRGVRTHFSDDRVWLPCAVHRYLQVTRDSAVLEEQLPFIDGPELPLDREDAHYQPGTSSLQGSLYEHCARALDRSLTTGAHGLPLIGGGDWNDGMNRVGHAGRGESVWLAWLLIATLRQFAPLAQARQEPARAERWLAHAAQLAAACEREAWDGEWYRRAFFDDGTPLGSHTNTECRIDSLAQSWAVLSAAADPRRARAAMEAVWQQLVRTEQGLVLLFTPPFDKTAMDPGYIKGYLPGLRENGGQYTHAAIWVLIAEAMLGNRARVGELLHVLNPIRHSDSRAAAALYRVEPYVLAADIYAGPGMAERGGWTWYTGASGWLYRAVLEYVLGIQVNGDALRIRPCVPDAWPEFEVALKLSGASYLVRMRRGGTQPALLLDGQPVAGDSVPILRDGGEHLVLIELPAA